MNVNNQRGEVTTAVVVAVAAVALLLGTLAPALNPFNRLFGGAQAVKAPSEEAWKEQTQITEPVTVGVTPAGEKVIAFRERREFRSGASRTPGKLTYGERVGQFFSGLTTWGLIFVVVSLAFFGGAPIVWLWRKYAVVKQAFKNTVAAIRDTDEETYSKLKPHLASKHDRRDRKIVDKLKGELQ